MPVSGISRATTGRLPEYLTYVKSLPNDIRFVSSTAIAKGLELGEVQVRKDLSAVCGKGKPKVGYDRDELLSSLETALDTRSGTAKPCPGRSSIVTRPSSPTRLCRR